MVHEQASSCFLKGSNIPVSAGPVLPCFSALGSWVGGGGRQDRAANTPKWSRVRADHYAAVGLGARFPLGRLLSEAGAGLQARLQQGQEGMRPEVLPLFSHFRPAAPGGGGVWVGLSDMEMGKKMQVTHRTIDTTSPSPRDTCLPHHLPCHMPLPCPSPSRSLLSTSTPS